MTCSVCSHFFCYSCGNQIDGYQHFNHDKATCKLFDTTPDIMMMFENIVRRPPNPNNIAENPDIDLNFLMFINEFPPKRCPFCGQRNAKINRNNDIACWSCTKHFCFLCGVAIKGTTHFVNSTCVQHS